jgi:putative MATE family efflux protein|uniref:MATE family efflux transporter n=1 Tax=Lachnospira sp. TaxID=2049031 RepID=UPI003FEDC871
MEKNLTTGSVLKTIIYFALPYLLSYFLQTLYGMADLYITGQFNGVDSITAVSNGSQVMHMLTVIIVGLAMGTTVIIGKAIGGNKLDNAGRAIGNTITLFMGIAIVMTIVFLIAAKLIVLLIGVPQEAVAGTVRYLIICFIGIPFITAYNIISSIFRGLGDSKSPMYFIGISCVTNITLDYVFIGLCDLGPSGAALGTVLSQTFSVIVAFISIRKRKTGIKLVKEDFIPDRKVLGEILKVGIPVAVQDGCIQVAFIIITVIANHRGLDDAAAVGIVEKMISAIFIIPSSMLATVSALSAQNIGAGKYDRAAKTLKYATMITSVYGVFMAVIMQVLAAPLLALFTKDAAVVVLGTQYMKGYIIDSIFAGVHFCFSGYFAAYGKSYIGFMHNIISITFVRVPGSYLASKLFGDTLFPMGLAAPAGSLLSVIICVCAYIYLKRSGKLEPVAA